MEKNRAVVGYVGTQTTARLNGVEMKKIGYFDDENREYVITEMFPRRPLKNYLWNDGMITEVNQFGFGAGKACIDKDFRTVVSDYRLIYVKDDATGEIYDANRNFREKPFTEFFARVGWGYQITESLYDGLRTQFTVIVPTEGYAEAYRVRLKNETASQKNFQFYFYIHPAVNLNCHDACGKAYADRDGKMLYYSFRTFPKVSDYSDIFFSADCGARAFELTEEAFFGTYGSVREPKALGGETLTNTLPSFEPAYAGVLQYAVSLNAGEEREYYFAVGTVRNRGEADVLAKKYTGKEAFEGQLVLLKRQAEEMIGKTTIQTEDRYLDSMTNIWLKRQMSLGKTWGRVYGKGFRDVLQDLTGFVSLDVAAARERLLNALKYEFTSGNAIRMFDPVFDYPYQDMPAWIAPALFAYLNESGDLSILGERIGYYDSDCVDSVLCHLKRANGYLFRMQGKRGLSLWGGGDWNDSLDNCGMQMKGESVWLSIAAVRAGKDFISVLRLTEDAERDELIARTEEAIEKLKAAIVKYGFEGDHFIYGFNDWDEKVGSDDCEEGKIFLNPQTWAVMAGILPQTESLKLLDTVEKRLKCDYGYVQNDPPYEKEDDRLGRLTYFGKGLYENGSVYNHGVMFKAVADCVAGRGSAALRTLELVRYDNPANPDSGVEPYAVSNMYFGPSAVAKRGFAPQAWITGSAGWMYRAIVEYLLGVSASFGGLRIRPCLPDDWRSARISRVFRGAVYEIEILRSKEKGIEADGEEIFGDTVPLFPSGSVHKIVCRI